MTGGTARRWEVRPFRPGDEEPLMELYARVFGRRRSVEVLRWKLLGRAAGRAMVWVAETPEGRLVGQYAGIPVELRLGGLVRPCVHAVEAMTDPDHRRQGILTALASEAHRSWQEAGAAAVVGLPNEQWRGPQRVLGYTPVGPLEWLRFPLRLDRVARRRPVLASPVGAPVRLAGRVVSRAWRLPLDLGARGVRVSDASPGLAEIDVLRDAVGARYRNAFVRDAAWVRWRFRDAPGLAYRVSIAYADGVPSGYIAYRLAGDARRTSGYIADLFTAPDDARSARALLTAALNHVEAEGAASAGAAVLRGSTLSSTLRRAGFLRTRAAFSFDVVPMDAAVVLEPAQTWQLTAGDFDIDLADEAGG